MGFFKDMDNAWRREFGKPKMSPDAEAEYRNELARQKARRDFKESEMREKSEDKRVTKARRDFGKNTMGSLRSGFKSIGY